MALDLHTIYWRSTANMHDNPHVNAPEPMPPPSWYTDIHTHPPLSVCRTWSYLESLFIHSEEVKKELPEATVRFATIDKEVKEVLKKFKETRNAVECCNADGLMKFLEKQQRELEVCEKALVSAGELCAIHIWALTFESSKWK
jgi:hypothetical protein